MSLSSTYWERRIDEVAADIDLAIASRLASKHLDLAVLHAYAEWAAGKHKEAVKEEERSRAAERERRQKNKSG